MDLALKDLRKAAEQEMGGINAAGYSNINLNELKSVIQKTTKVTKVGRYEEKEKPEDVTQTALMEDESEDDDGNDNEGSVNDIVIDTDGN